MIVNDRDHLLIFKQFNGERLKGNLMGEKRSAGEVVDLLFFFGLELTGF